MKLIQTPSLLCILIPLQSPLKILFSYMALNTIYILITLKFQLRPLSQIPNLHIQLYMQYIHLDVEEIQTPAPLPPNQLYQQSSPTHVEGTPPYFCSNKKHCILNSIAFISIFNLSKNCIACIFKIIGNLTNSYYLQYYLHE